MLMRTARRCLTVGCLTLLLAHLAQAQPERGPAGNAAGVQGAGPPRDLPAGYLGITFICKLKSEWGPEGLSITHYGYPAVASVEPESPAEAAGVQAGDTILAYDDRDVRNHPIVLNKLLRPNTRVSIRLRRNGQVRDVSVTVARRPQEFVQLPDAPLSPGAGMVGPPSIGPDAPITPEAPSLPTEPAAPIGPPPPRAPAVLWWTRPLIGPNLVEDEDDFQGFGGAQVVRTTPDLRQALGVSNGLLVVSVEPGTPAAEASLRAGDVIVSAGDTAVTTVRQLVRAFERTMATRNEITLTVERQHKSRRVVLQW
jgi:membrane-associated protease RseP (regulator of RpoE activity)